MSPQKIIGLIVLVVILAGLALFVKGLQKNKTDLPKYSSFSVANQYPGNSVFVSSVSLSEKGALVVNKEEKGVAGKTIGASILLTPGENKNITIKLSEKTRDGQILFVTLIKEDGQPMTGKKKENLTQRITVESGNGVVQKNGAKHIVRYTQENGFSPASLSIKAGDMVTFINESDIYLWVASSPHPTHTDYPEFDQKSSVEKSGTFSFLFIKVGVRDYHNHENPNHRGKIIVE